MDRANKNGTILVVDDDPEFLSLMQVVLGEIEGFHVQTCQKGSAAIQSAQETTPDLVVLDLAMPETNGWAVLESLRSHPDTSRTPVVIVSADVTGLRKRRSAIKQHGSVTIMEKPFDLMTLIRSIKNILKSN